MRVPASTRVHVDVGEPGHAIDHLGEIDGETGLLDRLAPGCPPRRLTGIEVSTGLQPHVETLVSMEHDTARTEHERRPRDVHRIGLLIERIGQLVEGFEERRDTAVFRIVVRLTFRDHASYLVTQRIRHEAAP